MIMSVPDLWYFNMTDWFHRNWLPRNTGKGSQPGRPSGFTKKNVPVAY